MDLKILKEEYLKYLDSPRFDAWYADAYNPPTRTLYLLAILFFALIICIPMGILMLWMARKARHVFIENKAKFRATARDQVPIMAYLVIVNRALLMHKGVTAPALTIGTFQPKEVVSDDTLSAHAEKLGELYGEEPENEAGKEACDFVNSDTYEIDRRRMLPAGFAQHDVIYAFDTMVFSDFLPEQQLELPFFPCMAEPGEKGSIHMIPWWVVKAAAERETSSPP